jgi:hypothetical protein
MVVYHPHKSGVVEMGLFRFFRFITFTILSLPAMAGFDDGIVAFLNVRLGKNSTDKS